MHELVVTYVLLLYLVEIGLLQLHNKQETM